MEHSYKQILNTILTVLDVIMVGVNFVIDGSFSFLFFICRLPKIIYSLIKSSPLLCLAIINILTLLMVSYIFWSINSCVKEIGWLALFTNAPTVCFSHPPSSKEKPAPPITHPPSAKEKNGSLVTPVSDNPVPPESISRDKPIAVNVYVNIPPFLYNFNDDEILLNGPLKLKNLQEQWHNKGFTINIISDANNAEEKEHIENYTIPRDRGRKVDIIGDWCHRNKYCIECDFENKVHFRKSTAVDVSLKLVAELEKKEITSPNGDSITAYTCSKLHQ